MMAAGSAIFKLYRNLSFRRHPCVLVAMMVVSEIKLRLSPKYEPPIMTATIKGRLIPVSLAIPQAIGVRAAMVPTLVPILSDTKHDAMNIPHSIIFMGTKLRVRFTVASIAPICLAVAAKAPARMKMRIIVMISSFAAPLASTAKRYSMLLPLNISMAYRHAARKDTIIDAA